MKKLIAITGLLIAAGCAQAQTPLESQTATQTKTKAQSTPAAAIEASGVTDTAIFAGGCFWCMESDYEKLPGVIEAVSGYAGGRTTNPTYKNHTTDGFYEVVEVTYDTGLVSYDELLDYFWVHVDPTDDGGQFCDRGPSYRTAIFARPDQIEAAQASKTKVIQTKPFSENIVTPVLQAPQFYVAEDYHQDYYQKNPDHYYRYRTGCRRDARTARLWGK